MDEQLKGKALIITKGMGIFASIMTLILIIVSFLFPKFDKLALILGIWFGTGIGIVNIFLIALNLETTIDKQNKLSAGLSYSGGYFLRLILSALVLILAAKVDCINIFTTAVGLISPQLVIFAGKIINKI